MICSFRAWAVALLMASLSPLVFAQDRLVMNNGDVITGEIKRLEKGDVYIEPPYTDEFSVSIDDVASIESGETMEVTLEDGSEVSGQFALDSAGAQVVVVDGQTRPLLLSSLTSFDEPRDYFTRDSNIKFSTVTNSGNTDSNANEIYADTLINVGDHRHNMDLTFRRDETDDVTTKEQDLFNYQYGWMFSDPWYVGGSFTYERDPIRDLQHRYVAGLNVGRDIWDDDVKFLTFSIGVGYSEEEIADEANSGAVGLWKLDYTHDLWGGDVSFFHNHSITQNFFAADNTIFKSNTGVRTELFADIYADVTFRYDYETEPAEGASKDDTTLSIGVGASF